MNKYLIVRWGWDHRTATDEVVADYVQMQDGMAIFTKGDVTPSGRGGTLVMAYGPGSWVSVTPVDES